MVALEGAEPFVVADIPGLIQGAHQGAGLGTRFLRHVERTRVLLHLVDAHALDPEDPRAAYEAINEELAGFSRQMLDKPQIVVLNKMDLPGAAENAERFENALPGLLIYRISAVTGQGIAGLVNALNELVNARKQADGS